MKLIGIDPGLKGAITIFDVTLKKVVASYPMPLLKVQTKTKTKSGKFKIKSVLDELKIGNILREYPESTVIIEQQMVMQGQGMSSNAFIKEQFGFLKGVCIGLGLKLVITTAKDWQKNFTTQPIDPLIRDEVFKWSWKPEEHKGDLVCYAKQNLPYLNFLAKGSKKPHSGLADSSLIAYSYFLNNFHDS